jgi:hypothetical protein
MQPSVLAPLHATPLAARRLLAWLIRRRRRVMTVATVMLLMAGMSFGANFWTAQTESKSSGVYAAMLAIVSHDPEVLAELGSPVEPGWFISHSTQISNAGGPAVISIPVSGPWRAGTVHAVAARAGGEWTFSTLSVTVEGNSTPIDLLRSP